MNIFHKHNWKEIARTYQPSALEVSSSVGLSPSSYWHGQENSCTTILWECKECQKTKSELLRGKII